MRAIVVDDEKLACKQLSKMLQETGAFETVRTYTDPEEALDDVKKTQPDVAFLDIEMPEMSGIELAEALQSERAQIQIAFTTAYNEFAIQAFELNAIDYVLKPIMKKRLEKTVGRLIKARETAPAEEATNQESFGIECLGSLKFYSLAGTEKKYIPVKWRTSRARELYAFLLNKHDRFVSKDTLIDLLWPEADPSRGTTQLYTTIYQIRKLMEKLPFHHHIVKNDIGYSLTLSGTLVDSEEWETALAGLPVLSPSNVREHIRLFRTYKNHYFAEYGYLWAEPERVRLSQLWLEQGYRLIDFLIENKNYTEALDICQQIDRVEPDDERSMKYEMTLYNRTGNVEGAIRAYEKYKENKNVMN
ncbi:response regulator [Sporolactobacillus shoreae]|uniref:Response regulator n=1 Tax=Sporolactobacillus shoreae TaxID=1465501 RepID=A0A4Z0GM97_9BACL|nr:response regulator [Sporolactobacillus shoreae]TGA97949.1 response regulator [Sporolactobacillus shoreae]